ncbi:RNA methyltransferase [Bifidobacterium pullorum subsp. saeculare]|uniref:RNA methyltransferase n=1 Tax=Bifidobacterium pullorum subsp. saeculare TaxID=78257 RepID=A0A938WWU2_9BIFI|nr:RNA methyltransferase [Bifidobacterium pullorum]MBM6699127.1 RNA methyltransferase [Bifidobacterium pullorum subsp. saeculare]
MPIHSEILTNPKADRVRRIADLARPKGRDKAGRFLVEGPQAVREAVAWTPGAIRDLYVAVEEEPDAWVVANPVLEAIVDASQQADSPIYVHLATPEVLDRISKDAQGILAVVDMGAVAADPGAVAVGDAPFVAACYEVRDPGNAGTVIRAADAAGCDAVALVGDCVDPLNPKVVRATAGSLFHLPVLRMEADGFVDWAHGHGMTVVAADVHGADGNPPEPLPALLEDQALVRGGKAVLFGNEAHGLGPAMLAKADRVATIPIYGKAESLNLATSAAVMLMGMAAAAHR